MAHKKRKFKQSVIDHADSTVKETAQTATSIDRQPLMSTKHDLSDDAEKATLYGRTEKRRKANSNTGLHHQEIPSSSIPATMSKDDTQHSEFSSGISTQELPLEIRHLSTKYSFTTMSILSSAKISDKVEKLLLRVENFSFADPKSKPGVVILHAKSEVASKMVSIVEIARQEIERDKGRWWQYSKLEGQVAELKVNSIKRMDDGKTLAEWQKEQAGGESAKAEVAGGDAGRASDKLEYGHGSVNGDEETEDAFEAMAIPMEAGQEAKQPEIGNGRKIRAIPVMTIYFARVPVSGLRELYGEQTNS